MTVDFFDILVNGEPNNCDKIACETIIFVCRFWMCLILANRKPVNIGMLNDLKAAVGLKLWHSHCFVAYLACQTQRLIHRLIQVPAKILDKKSTWTFSLHVLEWIPLSNETSCLRRCRAINVLRPLAQCLKVVAAQWEARSVYSAITGHNSWISRKIHEDPLFEDSSMCEILSSTLTYHYFYRRYEFSFMVRIFQPVMSTFSGKIQHGSISVWPVGLCSRGGGVNSPLGQAMKNMSFLLGELAEHRNSKFKRKSCLLRFPGLPARCSK